MLSELARSALLDIRDNIRLAREFICGLDYEEFAESKLHVYAVTRALEIISEASRRLPDDRRARHPELPWRAIRDVGNLYRHSYDDVEESYPWTTVHDHLAPLLAAVLAELQPRAHETWGPVAEAPACPAVRSAGPGPPSRVRAACA